MSYMTDECHMTYQRVRVSLNTFIYQNFSWTTTERARILPVTENNIWQLVGIYHGINMYS